MKTKQDTSPKLIGRHRECGILEECLTSPGSEFVIICGRRRVGKTFLADRFFEGEFDFKFVGQNKMRTRDQLRNFGGALKKYSNRDPEPFSDWFGAFDALEAYLETLPEDRKKVLFFDEMPWMDTRRSSFVGALECFWNGWAASKYNIVLIATGSATSWMSDKILKNRGGLYNRVTRRIYLKPFSLAETEEYLKSAGSSMDRYEILQCYMFTGGIPYYLSMIDPKLSLAQNIDKLVFAEGAPLRHEFNELYNAVFPQAESYIRVVELLGGHKAGLTKKEIARAVKLNGTFLRNVLDNLVQCDFVDYYLMFGKKHTPVYKLVDFFTLFHFKFIADHDVKDPEWWTHHLDDPGVAAWMGLTFELVCIRHHMQIKKALGISGMGTAVYTWKCAPDPERLLPGAQVDMVIERADRYIHLCEMKFSVGEYDITKEYDGKLRERMRVFKLVSGTKQPVVNTFVTTFGLGLSSRVRSIVHSEVTMDQLFEPLK